jgi:prolyl oligopeptidase
MRVMNRRPLVAVAAGIGAIVVMAGASHAKLPPTPKVPVVDTLWGTSIPDDYRWLEDASAPAVKSWSEAQNGYARGWLDSRPGVADIRARVAWIQRANPPQFHDLTPAAGGKALFAIESQPPKQQPFLVALVSVDDVASARVIVDPNTLDPSGGTAIDWAIPSHDGSRIAVSMSKGGSESGDVHVYDAATGKELGDVVPRVNGGTAGGSVAWNADGSGFWYTRYPRTGERPAADLDFYQQVYYHRIGTATAQDSYTIGKEFPKIAEIRLDSGNDGKRLLVDVSNGDGGEHGYFLLSEGNWTHLAHFADRVVGARFGGDGAVYVESLYGSPKGRILRVAADAPDIDAATVVIPEGDGAISSFVATKSHLYVATVEGGPSHLRVSALDGSGTTELHVGDVAAVDELVALGDDAIAYRRESYTEPAAFFQVAGAAEPVPTALKIESKVDFSDVEVTRVSAKSADGTAIPMTVLAPKGLTRAADTPLLLTGYGGYGLSTTPRFRPGWKVWLEQGGVIAIGNIRGGDEYGDEWHTAGNLTHKQNVFDDFYACAKFLVDEGYTRPEKLAIQGGSNGGLLMGAALTQHPEMYRAVVSSVGIYDMLHVENDPNGSFNTTEFGTVANHDQFDALYAYSPYHHVVDGTKYPAVLFMTGANDPRVLPYHSRKMTARLQASGTSEPVLLRTSATSGHGIGSSLDEVIAEQTDQWAFLFDRLGVTYKPIPGMPKAK